MSNLSLRTASCLTLATLVFGVDLDVQAQLTITAPGSNTGMITDDISFEPPDAGSLPYINTSSGTIEDSAVQFFGNLFLENQQGATFTGTITQNETPGVLLGSLVLQNRGTLNANITTSNDPAFGGDDTATFFTTSTFLAGPASDPADRVFDLGVGNDEIILRGGVPGFGGDLLGLFTLDGISNVERLTIEGESTLPDGLVPTWDIFISTLPDDVVFSDGVTIGQSNSVVVRHSNVTGAGSLVADIEVFNESEYRFIGGSLANELVGNLSLNDQAISVFNGTLTGNLSLQIDARMDLLGAMTGDVTLSNDTGLFVSGLSGTNDGAVVAGNVTLTDDAVLTFNGALTGDLTAGNNAVVELTGEQEGGITLTENAGLTFEGTHTGDLMAGDNSTTTFEGTLNGNANVSGDAELILGDDFLATVTGDLNLGDTSSTELAGTVEGNLTVQTEATFLPVGGAVLEGNGSFANDSVLSGLVTTQGGSNRLTVEGDLDLADNTAIELELLPGIYPDEVTVTIVTVEGTLTAANLTGTTAIDLEPQFSYLDAQFVVDEVEGEVRVTVSRNGTGFQAEAVGANQAAAAVPFEFVAAFTEQPEPPAVANERQELAAALNGLTTPAERQAALRSLSGEALASAPQASTIAARGFSGGMDRRSRMMQVFLAGGSDGNVLPTPQLASGDGVTHDLDLLLAASTTPAGRVGALDAFAPGVWVDVLIGDGDVDGDASFAGMDYDYQGLIAGLDIQVSREWIIGASIGYTLGDYAVSDLSSSGDLDTLNLGVYTAYMLDQWRINAGAVVAFDEYESSRGVTVGGLNRTAASDYSGNTYGLDAMATYQIDLGGELRLEPFGALAYYRSDTDAYSETGAGTANLTVASGELESFYTTLGARLNKALRWDRNVFTPEVRVGWQREWLDEGNVISAVFSGAGGATPAAITGVTPDQDAALLGLGITADFDRRFSLRLDYDTRVSDNQTDQQFGLSLRIPW